MPAHAGMRAPPLAPAPVPGSGSGSGSGSLPGLVLFESGLAGMGCSTTRTRPAPLRYPNRPLANGSEPPANGCLKTVWAVRPLCSWAVGPNGCDGSVRTVATVEIWRTRKLLPERYK